MNSTTAPDVRMCAPPSAQTRAQTGAQTNDASGHFSAQYAAGHAASVTRSALPAEAMPQARLALAIQRLDASRARLAQVLLPPDQDAGNRPHDKPGHTGSWSAGMASLFGQWRQRWQALPFSNLVDDSVRRWWQAHPWRPALTVTADRVLPRVTRWVRHHPMLSIGGAVAMGATVVWIGRRHAPWLSARITRLPANTAHWLGAQLQHLPWHAVLNGVLAVWAAHEATLAAQAGEAVARQTTPVRDGPAPSADGPSGAPDQDASAATTRAAPPSPSGHLSVGEPTLAL